MMRSLQEKLRFFLQDIQRRTAPLKARWQRFAERSPRFAKVVRWAALTSGVGLASLLGIFFAISLTVPSARKLKGMQADIASEVYSADSIPVQIGLYFKEFRIVATYSEIAPMVFNALVATEDERFFQHRGVDYRAWGRVLVRSILRGDRSGGGGSTISQQLAKNMLPRRSFPVASLVINKMREIIIARRLERVYEKKEILALYLNTVPFPENVYGINIAAQRFFNKKPSALTLEESATLVGTLRATTFYNPLKYPERARQRRNVVLQQMYKNGFIDRERLDAVRELPLELYYNPAAGNEGKAPYFREFLRQELERLLSGIRKPNGDPYNLYGDGLKIYTSLHTGMQAIAEEAVAQHLADMQKKFDQHWRGSTPPWYDVNTINMSIRNSTRYQSLQAAGVDNAEIERIFGQKVKMKIFSWEGGEREVEMSPLDSVRYHLGMLQTGFMAMDPYSGYIRAWVGGINHDYFQYDHVRANRQPGSVFKPVVYMQALRDNIPPCEQIPNRLVVYHEYLKGDWAIKDWRRDDPEPHFDPDGKDMDDWIPQNADGIYGGSYSLEGALTNSVNTVTVSLIMRMGVKKVVDLARSLGIGTKIPVEPSIALGTAELPLFDMIQPFASFASEGQRVRPVAVLRIENHAGEVIYAAQRPTRPEQVLTPEQANTMTRMLQSVASAGTASRLRWMYNVTDVPVAGKTGTSQNHADGWFIGYTPKLIAGAWVGGDSPLVRFRNFENGQGAATALPVVAIFLRKMLDNPALSNWHGGVFPEISPEQMKKLACPLRIPSAEELLADSLARDSLLLLEGLQLDLESIEQE